MSALSVLVDPHASLLNQIIHTSSVTAARCESWITVQYIRMWVGFWVVHVHTIIMHINKLLSAQHSCLRNGINNQIRVTNVIPLWGSENGKPGTSTRKQKLWPEEPQTARTRPTQALKQTAPELRLCFSVGAKQWEEILFTRWALTEQQHGNTKTHVRHNRQSSQAQWKKKNAVRHEE